MNVDPVVEHGKYTARLVGPFTYTVHWAALAVAAAPTDESVQVQNDSDFFWLSTSYHANIGGALQERGTAVVPLVTLQLSLVANPFTDSEAPLPSLAGGPVEGPMELAKPFWLYGGSTLKLSARNYATAGTVYDLYVSLHGFKYRKDD